MHSMVPSCGGWEIHEVGRAPGESLVGWYSSKTKAQAALRVVAKVHPAIVWLAHALASVQVAYSAHAAPPRLPPGYVILGGDEVLRIMAEAPEPKESLCGCGHLTVADH